MLPKGAITLGAAGGEQQPRALALSDVRLPWYAMRRWRGRTKLIANASAPAMAADDAATRVFTPSLDDLANVQTDADDGALLQAYAALPEAREMAHHCEVQSRGLVQLAGQSKVFAVRPGTQVEATPS